MSKGEIGAFLPHFSVFDKASVNPPPVQVKADRRRSGPYAAGAADVRLSDKDGGTLLTYSVEAQIGGKLAQLGQRLIAGAAKKMADDFFQKFAAAVASAS